MLITTLSKTATIIRCPGTIDAASLSQWMVDLRAKAPWHLPIFQSVLVGDLALVMPIPGQSLPMARLKSIGRPVIVMICDDGPISGGPDVWSCASFACDWARAIMVNGTGGHTHYYAAAVQKAREVGRVTICDCASEHLEDWRRCAIAHGANKPMIGFRPPPGEHHPVSE